MACSRLRTNDSLCAWSMAMFSSIFSIWSAKSALKCEDETWNYELHKPFRCHIGFQCRTPLFGCGNSFCWWSWMRRHSHALAQQFGRCRGRGFIGFVSPSLSRSITPIFLKADSVPNVGSDNFRCLLMPTCSNAHNIPHNNQFDIHCWLSVFLVFPMLSNAWCHAQRWPWTFADVFRWVPSLQVVVAMIDMIQQDSAEYV